MMTSNCTLRRWIIIFSIVSSSLAVFPRNIHAQNEPPDSAPGAQAERFTSEVEEKKKELEPKKEKPPEMKVEEAGKKPVPEGPSFTLSEIVVTGVALFTKEELHSIYEPYIGKKVTYRDLEEIADRIKALYKKRGYLTTIVYVPQQEIVEGKIELRAIEGVMGKLFVERNKYFSTPLIQTYIHEKMGSPLNLVALQRDLLRLNQNPDIEVKSVISAGEAPGSSDVTLTIKDRPPHHAGYSYDNQGSRLTGKFRNGFSFRSTNATGNSDSLFVHSLMTTDSFGQSVMYLTPIGTRGTKIGFDATYFTLRLGREYKQADILGESQIYTPHISQELYLSERTSIDGDFGIKIKSIKRFVDNETATNDQLREPYLGLDVAHSDALFGGGQTTFSPQVVFNTEHFLGSLPHDHVKASRNGSGGFFVKYEYGLRRIQRMPWESHILLRNQFQTATDTLPSSEQFQLGGANSIRGYPEGDYLADVGASFNLDWVFPLYFIPKEWKLPYSTMPVRRQIQPVLFFDMGGGRIRKTNPGEEKDKFLASLGGGLRINLFEHVSLRLEWAGRTGERPASGAGPSVFHLTVQSEI